MKVTKLVSQKRDPDRVNMYIDEEFFCGISLDGIAKFNIYLGKELEESDLEEILFEELKNRFFQRAINYISRAIKTEVQLKRYLRELSFKKKGKWFTDVSKESLEEIINDTAERLKEYNYLNDEVFAEEFLQSRMKNRPRGKSVLLSELISKGVNAELAKEKVEELVEDEYVMLKRIYEKKYGNENMSIQDSKKIDFLRRKGFSWDLINEFLNNEFTE
ncbi:MAG: RecX family transcriptional regulator [Candidatus Dojkabacteria bacterium]|jgi:regulatory protein|nr:RecX family transcriptional regulator [Candidatus Dojkabacteria bacterium]MDD4561364.1 RecX family transcriptional regulator [Candidatus Dojkabacteria bacterium]